VLIKEFLFEEGSGYSLADSQDTNSPAYLGIIESKREELTLNRSFNGDVRGHRHFTFMGFECNSFFEIEFYLFYKRALNFDSTSKYISIPAFAVSQPNPLVLASFTINFWIKLTNAPLTTSSYFYIFRFYNPSSPVKTKNFFY